MIKETVAKTGKDARAEIKAGIAEHMVNQNKTVGAAFHGLGKKVIDEDKEMFETSVKHETKLAAKVQKLIISEGHTSGYDSTMELTGEQEKKLEKTRDKEYLGPWKESEHEAHHAIEVAKDSLHTILTVWDAGLPEAHQTWNKVTKAFNSANTAAKMAHDTEAQVISSMELSTLLRETSVEYKQQAKHAYDKSKALEAAAEEGYEKTLHNKELIAGLEDATADAAGAGARAGDAAKKVSLEITEKANKK